MTTTLEDPARPGPAQAALLLAPLTWEHDADRRGGRHDRRGRRRQDRRGDRGGARRDRLGLALSELFATRDDLAGISPVADVLVEDLFWSV